MKNKSVGLANNMSQFKDFVPTNKKEGQEGHTVYQGLSFDLLYGVANNDSNNNDFVGLVNDIRNKAFMKFPFFEYARELSILAIAPENKTISDFLKAEAKRVQEGATAYFNASVGQIKGYINDARKNTSNAQQIISYATETFMNDAHRQWNLVRLAADAAGVTYLTGKAKKDIGNPGGLGDVPSKGHKH